MQTENVTKFATQDSVWQGLTLTPSAAKQVVKLMQRDELVKGIRLNIKKSGCVGFGYVVEPVDKPAEDDLLFEHDGACLFVPAKAMPFVDGTEIDFVREGLNQVFRFNNPQARHECGCGESFGV